MNDFLRRNPLLAALGVVCALLAAIVVFELAALGPNIGPGPTRKAAPAEAKLLPPVATASADQMYPETVNRPLWIPTRRPAPPVATAQAPAFTRGQFILQGVTIAGGTRIALLKEKASGRIHRIEKGRDVNGLQVAEVEPDKVVLSQGSEREVVDLLVQRPGGAAPGVPQSAPGGTAGPFAPVASPGGGAPAPGIPPSPSPFGRPLVAPGSQPPPGALPPGAPNAPAVANPSAQAVPQPPSAAPMTPEELLARRRARRAQSTPQ